MHIAQLTCAHCLYFFTGFKHVFLTDLSDTEFIFLFYRWAGIMAFFTSKERHRWAGINITDINAMYNLTGFYKFQFQRPFANHR